MTEKECKCGLAAANFVFSIETIMNRVYRGTSGIAIDPFYIGLSLDSIKKSAEEIENFCGVDGFKEDVKRNSKIIEKTISNKNVLNDEDLDQISQGAISVGQTFDSKLGNCAKKTSTLYKRLRYK